MLHQQRTRAKQTLILTMLIITVQGKDHTNGELNEPHKINIAL